MQAIGYFAVAVGLVCLVLIAAISLRGPRDRGGRLPGNGGPIVPWSDDGGGDGEFH
jgi:hypothetical protein